MPSAQVLNFGADPYANAMGEFANNFLDTLEKSQSKRRNDELFKRITNAYSGDETPERMFRDIVNAEGFDDDYKNDKLSQIMSYAALAGKENKTAYENELLDIRRGELESRNETNRINNLKVGNEQNKIANTTKRNNEQLPKQVQSYTKDLFKDENVSKETILQINKAITDEMLSNENLRIDQAVQLALEKQQAKNELIENASIQRKPGGFFKSAQQLQNETQQSFLQAEQQLQDIYDQGITSQSDLRKIALKGDWTKEEINQMIQRIFARDGRKSRQPKKEKSTEKEKDIIVDDKQENLDDLLFGE